VILHLLEQVHQFLFVVRLVIQGLDYLANYHVLLLESLEVLLRDLSLLFLKIVVIVAPALHQRGVEEVFVHEDFQQFACDGLDVPFLSVDSCKHVLEVFSFFLSNRLCTPSTPKLSVRPLSSPLREPARSSMPSSPPIWKFFISFINFSYSSCIFCAVSGSSSPPFSPSSVRLRGV
jgi:hypothetical protein